MALNEPRCYLCGAVDGKRGAIVLEATVREVKIKHVPVGVGLCSECGFCSETEIMAAGEPDEFDQIVVEMKRREIAEELKLDLEEDRKEWARWSNTFTGW